LNVTGVFDAAVSGPQNPVSRETETDNGGDSFVIPRLFDGKGSSDSVCVWAPGCATGEEAYSLAILPREYMDNLKSAPKVQLFTTDIDDSLSSWPTSVKISGGRHLGYWRGKGRVGSHVRLAPASLLSFGLFEA
jgi:CheR methyltransferase, SAM binding domain